MSRYDDAKQIYAKYGVDTDKAIETLKKCFRFTPLLAG